jgi:serine phosphatase RsbU (regulator of sigma subunit)
MTHPNISPAKMSFKRCYALFVQWFRDRMTIHRAISAIVGSAIMVAGAVMAFYALSLLREHKLSDTWAIQFLELEQKSHRLTQDILFSVRSTSNIPNRSHEYLEFEISPDEKLVPVAGLLSDTIDPKDLGFADNKIPGFLPQMMLLKLSGYIFNCSRTDREMHCWKIHPKVFQRHLGLNSPADALVYVLTREGQLVYSNRESINSGNYFLRPLVQKFIKSPITSGQIEFSQKNGRRDLGFYFEIPESNLIVFAEVDRDRVLGPIHELGWHFLIAILLISGLCLIVTHKFLQLITSPLEILAKQAELIGKGNFIFQSTKAGFGEVHTLFESFRKMTQNLHERDQIISRLTSEQIEKFRFESELKIAQNIQNNFLPQQSIAPKSGIDIEGKYIPATECSGDWYSYHYCEASQETIFVVADVSGHGAGASMFTAVIAALFEQYKIREPGSWDLMRFLEELNTILFQMGRQKWHASMLIGRYRKVDQSLELFCAGHLPPFCVVAEEEGAFSSGKITLPSSLLGLSEKAKFAHKHLAFPKGSILFLHTDGFNEALTPKGKQMTSKNIDIFLRNLTGMSAKRMAGSLIDKWDKHRDGRVADDDVCIIVVLAL